MNIYECRDKYLCYFIPLSIVFSVILYALIARSVQKDLLNKFQGMEFVIESNAYFDANLYYTYSSEFNTTQQIQNSKTSSDSLLFLFPVRNEIVKKFRLDLGSNPQVKKVKIKSLQLQFEDKKIILDEKQVFNSFLLNSASVYLDKNERTIYLKRDIEPFDPYVVFSPLSQLIFERYNYRLIMLIPFLIVILFYIIKYQSDYLSLLNILVVLFIICIPLKIAWTTFSTLLLTIYGIGFAVRNKTIHLKNNTFFFFITLLCLLLILGRPSSYATFGKYFALLFFAIISITISIETYRIYRNYAIILLFYFALIVASGISFLLWFKEFYGLEIAEYFTNIKIHSGNIRNWIYYDHAAFLSFFGLVGTLFIHNLYERKQMNKWLLYLYHLTLFLFIVLVGSRICLLIYFIFLLNLLVKWNVKKGILLNTLLFVFIATSITYNLQKIDANRHQLWTVSWEAIKERPWFGYGIGKSKDILYNPNFLNKTKFTTPLDLNHSHNQYITLLLEIGAVGVFALTGVFIYFMYRSRLYRNTTMVLFIFGLCYMFLTESILQTSKPLYVVCFLFLLITTEVNSDTKEKVL